MVWRDRRVLVTGGASFIGSALSEALVARGARVHVVDDLSSGKVENIQHCIDAGKVTFTHADLREPGVARAAMQGIQTVFHLAADHGGRGRPHRRATGGGGQGGFSQAEAGSETGGFGSDPRAHREAA